MTAREFGDDYVHSGATWTNRMGPALTPDPLCELCHGTGWEPKIPWSHPMAPITTCFVEAICRQCRRMA